MSRSPARRASGPRKAALPAALLALLLAGGCSQKSPPPAQAGPRASRRQAREQAEARERALQAATFDHAWQRIADTYPHRDFRGLDWAAVKAELRPSAERCRSAAELRPVLREMLDRLGESHFVVLPGDGLRAPAPVPSAAAPLQAPAGPADEAPVLDGDIGLEIRQVGDEFLVSRVDDEGPAAAAGVRPGWTILAVGDQSAAGILRQVSGTTESAARYLGWAVLNGAMRGEAGSAVTIRTAPPEGTPRILSLTRRESPGALTTLGNMPGLVADLQSRELPGGIGYIRFNYFLAPVAAPFTEAVKGFIAAGAPGIIVDVRGNPGGMGGLVMGMAGHFIREPGRSLGAMKTREADLNFVANPRGPGAQFDGPVAILVDGLSLSTSELFAAGLQQLGRARVFGERTGGMALPSIVESLPNGDRLQFAVADLVAPGGRRIEGVGVLPDVEIPLRKEDLVAGRDAALQAAVEWIDSAVASPPSGG